jgi:hypothetical protein
MLDKPRDRKPLKCARCNHPQDWHRLDDSKNVSPTDPKAEFRCIGYDCEKPGLPPPALLICTCPDFVREQDVDRWIRELNAAGWKRHASSSTNWVSPWGAWYRGPFKAWQIMNAQGEEVGDAKP